MTAAHIAIWLLAVIAFVCGLAAAYFWFRSAAGKMPNVEVVGSYASTKGKPSPMEEWLKSTAKNNRIAAILSGISVAAGAISNTLSSVS